MRPHPRVALGSRLEGEVLEVGPGNDPFPTAPGARVTFADRSVAGGRDATWPELAATPRGPKAHLDIDLDKDGLSGVCDCSFDGVVASHVIEHLANPLAVLAEFRRVLRPGGVLVLVVPNRHLTFDAPRSPTSYAHVREEFTRRVTVVDDEHIRDFCAAVFSQPPIHPPAVRAWHDPDGLDESLLDLHRRRSVHAHCWAPEEFASLLACSIADGNGDWRIQDLYFHHDFPDEGEIEFGIALERVDDDEEPTLASARFIADWCELALRGGERHPEVLVSFAAALARDLPTSDLPAVGVAVPAQALTRRLIAARAEISQLKVAMSTELVSRSAPPPRPKVMTRSQAAALLRRLMGGHPGQ